jgi:hypothetical protein
MIINPGYGNALLGSGATPIVKELLITAANVDTGVPQNPVGLDTPLQINFGAPVANPSVTVAANGDITFIKGGTYFITLELSYARSGAIGTAALVFAGDIDGTQSGYSVINEFENIKLTSTRFANFINFTAGQVLTFSVTRNSLLQDGITAGADDGGLYAMAVVNPALNVSPSALLTISRTAV